MPRGIRNNNPLNIRIGNVWLGESNTPDDPDFEQFVQMEYGVRAAFVLLRRYIKHYHRETIEAIIKSWAPASENNTTAYIKRVSEYMGVNPDVPLDYADMDTMCNLFKAMCIVENGQCISEDKIIKGYKIA